MWRKYRIQKHSKIPFTRLTGVECVEVMGGDNCLVSKLKSHKRIPIQQYAYYIHNDMFGIEYNPKVHIKSTCGVANCIKKEHLQGTYKPYKEDQKYIADNIKTTGLSHMAHMLKVTPELLQHYLDTHIDIV